MVANLGKIDAKRSYEVTCQVLFGREATVQNRFIYERLFPICILESAVIKLRPNQVGFLKNGSSEVASHKPAVAEVAGNQIALFEGNIIESHSDCVNSDELMLGEVFVHIRLFEFLILDLLMTCFLMLMAPLHSRNQTG